MDNPQVVFTWKAPIRPYKKRSSLILRFYVTVALLLGLIVWFFGDKVLLIPIGTVLFLFYVLTITPPPEVENKITTFGIETAGVTLRWESLSHFYFTKRFGFYILTLVGHAPFFYHAYVVVPQEDVKKNLILILSQHVVYQEKPNLSLTDKMVNWFMKLLPDDDEEVEPSLMHKEHYKEKGGKSMKVSRPVSSSKPQPASL
ncbi:hypothetical protein A3B40_01360 [Candidatus Roizmanbacteria bacterium RIFCSPLOWO2_01_FULL_37_16]|uniref:DUF5673 domain-containing protein n=1 Tax=Candidatus Roizmanbacteria bacterium RIFCSPLOWO2_01_FULL_37_16 TaxID=1802058 RepID=A0A1F7INS8_9BACT|nr:MAG: hypothetical protein A3B40_01360 [Candidatus Roizmanbacteria bacterium RIFCSPLOWO2_01_FULL_37_16]